MGRMLIAIKLVDDIYDVLKGEFPTTHNFDKKEAVFDNAWGCAASFKNPSFMSEREYRVLTLPTWKGKRFALIKRIVVGPKSPQNIEDLREWLRNNGLGELSGCVVKSESSLR